MMLIEFFCIVSNGGMSQDYIFSNTQRYIPIIMISIKGLNSRLCVTIEMFMCNFESTVHCFSCVEFIFSTVRQVKVRYRSLLIESIKSSKSDWLQRLIAFVRWKFLLDEKTNRRSFIYHSTDARPYTRFTLTNTHTHTHVETHASHNHNLNSDWFQVQKVKV